MMAKDPRILVVDDDVGPREALRMIFKSHFEVMTASSGPQALELVSQSPPDLVLLDIKMPGMNGIEVLKAIKQIDASIEVVIMTAYASLDTARAAVAYQASEYLTKPFSKREVEKAVDKALARRAEQSGSRQEVRMLLKQLRTLSQVTLGEEYEPQMLRHIAEILEQSRQAMHATAVLYGGWEGTRGRSKEALFVVPQSIRQDIKVSVWQRMGSLVEQFRYPLRLPLPGCDAASSDLIQWLTGGAYKVCTLFPIRSANVCQEMLVFLYETVESVRQDWRQLGQTLAEVVTLTQGMLKRYQNTQQSGARQAQRAAQLGIVREISRILIDNLDLYDMLSGIGEQLQTGLGYDGVAMWLHDENASCPMRVYASASSKDWCDEVLRDGFPVQLRIETHKDGQILLSPIQIEGEVIGTVALHRPFSDGRIVDFEVELIRMALAAVAAAVKNSQLYTEIEQTKSCLENLINDAGDAIVTLNIAGEVTSWNSSAERIFGYSAEHIVGQKICTIMQQPQHEAWQQSVFSQGAVKCLQTRMLRRDGVSIDTSLTLSPLHGPRAEVVGFSAIIKDVTADNKLREQLVKSEKLRALGEMAPGVAHNFNNALTAILGHAQLLMTNANLSLATRDGLIAIQKAGSDAAQVVKRIQAFARNGHSPLPCQPVTLQHLVREVVEMTRPAWTQRVRTPNSIELRLLLDDVDAVLSRPAELREVLINLILNAVDAMPEGGVITLRTLQQEGFGCIVVEDTGIGMDKAVQRQIFDPFFSTKKGAGRGLGLSVSYTLIRNQGGNIEVASAPGKGTRFLVKLLPASYSTNDTTLVHAGRSL
jgi:PAS domain S-box-containing protein